MPSLIAVVAASVILSAAKDLSVAAKVPARGAKDPSLPTALPNDNRTAAGVTVGGVRRIRLVVKRAAWHPDADDGPSLVIEAMGEEGKLPQVPGPLIRVRRGTSVDATVRNTLRDTLVIWVQQSSTGTDSTLIAPGETRALRVRTDRPGTFSYGTMLARDGHLVTNVGLPM